MQWYDALNKPSWTPSPATIGTIWTLLYPVILVSMGYLFWLAYRGRATRSQTAPFVINLILNALFTPIQFGTHSLLLATVDILLIFVTLIWAIGAVWQTHRWIAVAQLPYLLWVSVATILQVQILLLNH